MGPGVPKLLLALLVILAVQAPFLGRPVHYDETNFLALARGAVTDPWRPHDVRINWQGTEERAFDVLSNPPGIAWWLAPVAYAPVAIQRAWMLPWLALAALGASRLGERFVGGATRGVLLLLTAPIVLLSGPALLPDAPLYALTLTSVGGFVHATDRGGRAWAWALLAGCAALFRYSGLALAPLLVLYAILRGRPRLPALPALVAPAALALHDLHAYGDVHVLAMGRFQSVATTELDLVHKLVAGVAMLGGAGALPIFAWRKAAFGGALLGAVAAWPFGGALFGALGGAALGATAAGRDRDRLWLAAWAFGGLCFLLTLRFTATRYWLPFLPGALLALPTTHLRARVVLAVVLGTLLATDDLWSARAQRELADQVAALGPPGAFTGHWGWQWAMEARGWRALDEGERPRPGELVALPREAWPQGTAAACSAVVAELTAEPPAPWLPRGYSSAARVNLHASWIAGNPPVRSVAPWGFATDPYERVLVCRE